MGGGGLDECRNSKLFREKKEGSGGQTLEQWSVKKTIEQGLKKKPSGEAGEKGGGKVAKEGRDWFTHGELWVGGGTRIQAGWHGEGGGGEGAACSGRTGHHENAGGGLVGVVTISVSNASANAKHFLRIALLSR